MRTVCGGTFWVASRVSSTVSNFKRKRGIPPETLQRERASSRDDGGTSWFFSSCSGILDYDGKLRMPLVLAQGSPISN